MSVLKHLRSSTADKRPVASGLADGQLAINTASGTPALFFRNSASGVVKVGPAHVGPTAPNAVPAGSAGNSLGELWIDNSTTVNGLNYYNGASFVNLTPSGTTSTPGLVELATNGETQAGSDAARAVTPAALQSKVSDSISTTSSTTIASATAVKTAYDLANAALARTGGTVTGEIVISPSGAISFEGSTDDGFETTLAVVNPTADRTITFPNITGTVITSADTGTVTSTMIADGTIVNADINASASIALSKLATGALPSGITIASSNIVDGTIVNADINAAAAIADTKLATISSADKISLSALNIDGGSDIGADLADADLFIVDDGGSGTNRKAPSTRLRDYIFSKVSGHITTTPSGVATIASGVVTSAMIVDGTIVNADVNASAAIAGTKISPNFGAQNVTTTGTSTAASFIPSSATVPTNGVYLPDANSVGISTNGTGRLSIDSAGNTSLISCGLRLRTGRRIDADVSTGNVSIFGGAGDGANIELYGGSHATLANLAIIDADEVRFRSAAGSSERLRITSAGLVGIGTSSPVGNLDVTFSNSTAYSSSNMFAGGISQYIYNSSTTDGVASTLALAAKGPGITAQAAISAIYSSTGVGHLAFGTRAGGNVIERMRVTSNGVGIGTTSPGSALHVQTATVETEVRLTTTGGAVRLRGFNDDLVVNADQHRFSSEDNATEYARIDSSGRLLVGTSSDSGGALLQVNGDRIRVAKAKTPASATTTGTAGEICWDANYVYVCTATNTWKRAALSTW